VRRHEHVGMPIDKAELCRKAEETSPASIRGNSRKASDAGVFTHRGSHAYDPSTRGEGGKLGWSNGDSGP